MVKYKNFGDRASTSATTSNGNGNRKESSPDSSSTLNAAEILSFTGSTKTEIARGSAGGGCGQVTSPIPIPFDESKEQQQQQQQGEKNSIPVVDSRCDDNDGNQDHGYSHDDDRQEYPASAASSGFRDEASNSLREEFIEAESESLYDTTTITYHGGTVLSGEEQSQISVCPSSYYGGDSVGDCFSDSYMDTDSMSAGTGLSSMFGTTNESMTLSPCTVSSRSQRGHSPNTRRSKKLSYIGYNPVSPTTAARNIFNSCSNKNMINNDNTTNLNNDTTQNDNTNTNSNITAVANVIAAAAAINNNSNNNNSAATTTGVATTCNTGTSGTGNGDGEGEECGEDEFYSTISPANTAVTTVSATIAEYLSPGQQRVLEEEEEQQQQQHCWPQLAVAQQQQQLQRQRQPPSLLLSTQEQHEAIADLGRQRFFLQQQQHKQEEITNRTNTTSSTALSGDGGDGDGDNGNGEANGGISDSIPATTTTTTTASSVTSSVVPNVNKNSIFSNIMMYPTSRSNNLQECHHQQQPFPSTSIVSPPTIRRLIPINNNHNHNHKDGVVQNNDSTNNNDMIDCGISPVCTDVTSVTEPLQPLPHQQHQLMPPLLNHVAQPPPPRPPPPLPASTMMMIQQQQQHNLLYQQQQQQVYGYYGNNQPHQQQYQQITNGIHNNSNSNSQHQLPPHHPQQYSMMQSTTNNSSSSQRGGAALPFSPTDIGGAAAYPRTPALAEQLHAFHKYHHQDQHQNQHQHQHQHQNQSQSQHQSQHQYQQQLYDVGVGADVGVGVGVGVGPTVVGATNTALAFMKGSSSTENNRTTGNNDTNTLDGPEGPKLSNVKFVTPNSVSGSSTQRTTNVGGGGGDGSYGGGGGASCSTNNTEFGGVLCAQYPAGKKCEALFTNFFNTCSAIVNHGYTDGTQQTITTDQHGNTKKKSSTTKKKRSELEKIADQSLAELAPLPPSPPPPPPENLKDNNNNNNDVDNKMIDDSFLTSAAYTYQNVYDTFQKYYEPEEATLCEEDAVIESSNTGEREGGVEGSVTNAENERSTAVVASAAAQVTTREAATMIGSPVVFMSADNSDAVVYREISGDGPNEVGEEIDRYQPYQQQQQHGQLNIDTTATAAPVDTTTDDDVLQIEDDKSAVAEATKAPNKKVEMFKKLRQRRRRKRNDSDSQSPIRRTSSAPHTSSPISSVASYSKSVEGSAEKTGVEASNNANAAAEWQQRYRLNIHTRTMLINNEMKDPDPDQDQQDDPTRKYGVQQFSTSETNEEKTNGSSDNNDTIKKKEESEEGGGVARVETVERRQTTQPTTLKQQRFSMYTDIREDQESRCNNNANGEEHPTDLLDIMSMQTCTYSWATPPEEEEESLKGSMDEHEEFSSVQQQSINTPSVIDDEEEEERGGELTEEVLQSTSSNMSESLVGSDMDDDEQPLDCTSFNSMEEPEKDEINNYHGVEYDDNQDQDQDDEEDDTENGLLEESFDNNEFPHTELEVILEGSKEEMTEEHTRTLAFFTNNTVDDTVLTTTDSGDFSIDECLSSNDFEEEVHEKNNRDVRSEEASRLERVEPFSEERIRSGIRFSIYGLLKVVFTLVLMLQCCIVIDRWDQVADHVKSIDGGPYVIATLEDIALSLKSKGSSLSGLFLATPNDLIKLEPTQEGIVKKLDEEEEEEEEELSQEGDQSVAKDFTKLESAEDFVKFIEEELSQVDHRRDDIHKSEDNNSVAPEDPRKVTAIATEPPSDNDDELRLFQQLMEEALVPIDNEIQFETVVEAVVPPSIVKDVPPSIAKDVATKPKSEWVQELEDSLEV